MTIRVSSYSPTDYRSITWSRVPVPKYGEPYLCIPMWGAPAYYSDSNPGWGQTSPLGLGHPQTEAPGA
jgi:hypothetical protein